MVHSGGRWPLTELTERVMSGCVTWRRRLSKNLPNEPCRGSLVGASAATRVGRTTTDWKRREDVTRHDTRTYTCATHVHTHTHPCTCVLTHTHVHVCYTRTHSHTPVYVCVNSHARTRVLHTYTLTHTRVRVC